MTKKKNKIIKIIVPIYGLSSISKNIVLNSNIKIRNIDYEKETDLLKSSGFDWKKYGAILDIKYEYKQKNIDEPYPAIQSLLDRIESALRVFNPGIIGFAGIISQPKVSPFPVCIEKTSPSGSNKYKTDTTLSEFPEFYKKFNVAYSKKQIAFNRFSKFCSSAPVIKVSEDKIIDYCICLENLFVLSNSREKSCFVQQGFVILGFSREDIEKIKILFEYRNSIVHADFAKQKQIEQKQIKMSNKDYMHVYNADYYEKIEEIIRKALQYYIEKPW